MQLTEGSQPPWSEPHSFTQPAASAQAANIAPVVDVVFAASRPAVPSPASEGALLTIMLGVTCASTHAPSRQVRPSPQASGHEGSKVN
ncbi:MAG TPA: hypothetical protein VMF89_20345, partial [Polyangiales bacterium]|nr:hypothetical protein [Polyangiales bacterium]